MALSGSQKTRIGGYLSGTGKKQTFSAKAASNVVEVPPESHGWALPYYERKKQKTPLSREDKKREEKRDEERKEVTQPKRLDKPASVKSKVIEASVIEAKIRDAEKKLLDKQIMALEAMILRDADKEAEKIALIEAEEALQLELQRDRELERIWEEEEFMVALLLMARMPPV